MRRGTTARLSTTQSKAVRQAAFTGKAGGRIRCVWATWLQWTATWRKTARTMSTAARFCCQTVHGSMADCPTMADPMQKPGATKNDADLDPHRHVQRPGGGRRNGANRSGASAPG